MLHEFNGKKYKKASTHQKEWGNKIISEFSLKGTESNGTYLRRFISIIS